MTVTVPTLPMSDPLANQMLRAGASLTHNVECEAVVHVQQAYLAYHGPDRKYRPYLRLSGEMRSLKPTEPVNGVGEVTERPSLGAMFDVYYEFDEDQLATLVDKGYFEEDFAVPSIMIGVDYQLPVTASFLVLEPRDEQEVPVVFVEIPSRNHLVLDLETSGYDLAEYFVSVREAEIEVETELDEYGRPVQDHRAINDIFKDPRFLKLLADEPEQVFEPPVEQESVVEDGIFAAKIKELAQQSENRDEAQAGGSTLSDPEIARIYAEVVGPYVDGQMAGGGWLPEVAEEAATSEPGTKVDAESETDAAGEVEQDDESDEINFDEIEIESEDETVIEPISTGEAGLIDPQGSGERRKDPVRGRYDVAEDPLQEIRSDDDMDFGG